MSITDKRKTLSRKDGRPGSAPSSHIATIANGASLSDSVHMIEETLIGLIMPAAWTAAGIGFEVSHDGTNFYELIYDGSELALTVSAGQAHALVPEHFYPWQYLKVRSGTSSVPVNQGAEREVILLSKPL